MFFLDPLPGGCNLEFNLENDPNFRLTFDSTKTLTEYQFANHGNNRSSKSAENSCEKYSHPLTYHWYAHYLPGRSRGENEYFDVIKMMMSPIDIVNHGTEVCRR